MGWLDRLPRSQTSLVLKHGSGTAPKNGEGQGTLEYSVITSSVKVNSYVHLTSTWHHSRNKCSQAFPIFCHSSSCVYYTERKPKSKKWGKSGNEAGKTYQWCADVPEHQVDACRHSTISRWSFRIAWGLTVWCSATCLACRWKVLLEECTIPSGIVEPLTKQFSAVMKVRTCVRSQMC